MYLKLTPLFVFLYFCQGMLCAQTPILDSVVTNGGRVLGVTAWSTDLQHARDLAYEAVSRIQFEGAHFRHDIAAQALSAQPAGMI